MPKLEKVMADDVKQTVNMDLRVCMDRRLSYAALGLAVHIQSFNTDPEKGKVWEFSVKGLMELYPNKETSIRSALNELKDYGYLEEKRVRGTNGHFSDLIYTYHQKPISVSAQNRRKRRSKTKTDNLNQEVI